MSLPRTLNHLLHHGPVQTPRSTWNVPSTSTPVHTLFHGLFLNNILPKNPEVITPLPRSHGSFHMGQPWEDRTVTSYDRGPLRVLLSLRIGKEPCI